MSVPDQSEGVTSHRRPASWGLRAVVPQVEPVPGVQPEQGGVGKHLLCGQKPPLGLVLVGQEGPCPVPAGRSVWRCTRPHVSRDPSPEQGRGRLHRSWEEQTRGFPSSQEAASRVPVEGRWRKGGWTAGRVGPPEMYRAGSLGWQSPRGSGWPFPSS